MPKLIVLVEKDENGKLWDYPLTENQLNCVGGSVGPCPLMIHKPLCDEAVDESKVDSTPARDDLLTFGVIPQEEQIVQVKTRLK